MKIFINCILLSFAILFISCGEAHKDKIKLQQYSIEGKRLYNTYCANCHQPNGSGLGVLIPPISASFISSNPNLVACGIKYGISGSLKIDDIFYDREMPGFNNLTPLEIAEIMTFLNTNWGNKKEVFSLDSVEKALSKCTISNN